MNTMQNTATTTPRITIRPARPVRSAEPTVIPNLKTIEAVQTHAKKRVAGYARVSTEFESQEGSYALQCQHYADYISEHEDWIMVKVYADEGKTGTSTRQRTEFRQMIRDAEDGKIDLLLPRLNIETPQAA